MRKTIFKLSILSFSAVLFLIGLVMFLFNETAKQAGLACIASSALIFLGFAVVGIIKARKYFGWKVSTILKICVSILAFVFFTVGLGLFLVGGMIVLGIVLAAIGLLTIIFIIPMFVAFVRANPFEHIIVTPNYDDIDTEFFSNPKHKQKQDDDD